MDLSYHAHLRHCAYFPETGEVLECANGHQLKRAVAKRKRLYGTYCVITHDYGKNLFEKGERVRHERARARAKCLPEGYSDWGLDVWERWWKQ